MRTIANVPSGTNLSVTRTKRFILRFSHVQVPPLVLYEQIFEEFDIGLDSLVQLSIRGNFPLISKISLRC